MSYIATSAWALLAAAGNHLWQSTLMLGVIALVASTLRNDRAQTRYALWCLASIKFTVPFAVLVALGRQLSWQRAGSTPPSPLTDLVDVVSQPFSNVATPALGVPTETLTGFSAVVPSLLIAIWLGGTVAVSLAWLWQWRRMTRIVRGGLRVTEGREHDILRRLERTAGMATPTPFIATSTSLEPGVFGIVNPVLLWSRRLDEQLTDREVEAILAHEMRHVKRRDNLMAAVHMLVEAVFWFHPLVWWLETRLMADRERACDEDVLRAGQDPRVYAESLLKICQLYLESPLTCVAGVTGSDLTTRIGAIMRHQPAEALSAWKKGLLAASAVVAVVGPVAIGVVNAPRLLAQAQAGRPVTGTARSFDVASVKPNNSTSGLSRMEFGAGGRFTAVNMPLRQIILIAFRVRDFQLQGGSPLLNDRFDIAAKAEGNPTSDELQLMVQDLLRNRFRLATHQETRDLPVYALTMARGDRRLGGALRRSAAECASPLPPAGIAPPPPPPPPPGTAPLPPASPYSDPNRIGGRCPSILLPGHISGRDMTIGQLANVLARFTGRVVIDRTSLPGNFDLDLRYTPDQAGLLPGEPPPPPTPPPPPGSLAADTNAPVLVTAIQEQLGLKLEASRGPVDVLVIDRVMPPTDNQATSQPAQSPPVRDESTLAFEAISIKPNNSGDWRREMGPAPGGRFTATNVTLGELIPFAFGLPVATANLRITGGPQWLHRDRFDVVATTTGMPTAREMSVMLRKALLERFGLRAHDETRNLPAYALVMASGDRTLGVRLRRSAVSEEACAARREALRRNEPVPPPAPSAPPVCGTGRNRSGEVTSIGLSTAWLVDTLGQHANRVVVDRTGLAGLFDIQLTWTPDQIPAPRPGEPDPVRIDPNGPSLFTALQEQLGLKLESITAPLTVLVIDRVDTLAPD